MTANPFTTLCRLVFDVTDDAELDKRVHASVTPEFTFRHDGRRDDVEGFLAHLYELRHAMTGGEITILDELVDRSSEPARAAARITVRMRMRDGSVVEGESQAIGVLDGDRVAALHELGRYIEDGDDRPEPTRTTC